jgi:hypothetical protein
MSKPLIYILAPFALAFVLFVVYLIVAIVLRDPARPFRMFAAPPLDLDEEKGGEEGPQEKTEEGKS